MFLRFVAETVFVNELYCFGLGQIKRRPVLSEAPLPGFWYGICLKSPWQMLSIVKHLPCQHDYFQ